MAPTPDGVPIFDTTLRDGEQAPGRCMTHAERVGRSARDLCEDVDFTLEDASCTELEVVAQVAEAIEASASTVNIPDTIGCTVPEKFTELFRYVRKNVHGVEGIRFSVRCRNDFGMAVANSLTAVLAGVRQVDCAIGGSGKRCSRCPLDEVVPTLKTREAFFTSVPGSIRRACTQSPALPMQNKAVVGEDALFLEADIH